MTSNKKFGMIRGMASLWKQRRMVKALDNFYGETGYSNEETRRYRLKNQSDGAVPEEDFLGHLEINKVSFFDHIKLCIYEYNFSKKNGFILKRRDKILRIFKDSLSDGYIEKVYENSIIIPAEGYKGVTPSGKRGKDLTHFNGFLEAYLTKYPLSWKVIVAIFGSGVMSYIIVQVVRHLIFKLPYG